MTVAVLRPTSTDDNDGCTVTGAATVHAALSDDSDSSYITSIGSGDEIQTVMGTWPTASGALLKSIAYRARHARTSSGSMQIEFDMHVVRSTGKTIHLTGRPTITWTNITTNEVVRWTAPAGTLLADITELQSDVEKGTSTSYRLYEMYADVTYVIKPVTSVSDPTGTILDTTSPEVSWGSDLDQDGGPQTKYQVKIFSAAQYGAGGFAPGSSTAYEDSGEVSSSDTAYQPNTPQVNGTTYRAYVRVAQTVNGVDLWGDWANSQYTINATPPNPPAVAATADIDVAGEDALGRIKITITGGGTGGGAATTDYLEVQRSADGVTWEQFRNDGDDPGIVLDDTATLYDYETGNGVTYHYRARGIHDYSGTWAYSDWTEDEGAWGEEGTWWLKCPENPDLNLKVVPLSQKTIQKPFKGGVWQPLGSSTSVSVQDGRGSDRGTIQFQVDTEDEQDALDLLYAAGTLLLQGAPGDHWRDRYITIADVDRSRWVDRPWILEVVDTFTWYEVRKPTGPQA